MKKTNKCVICGSEFTPLQMADGKKICLVCAKDVHMFYHVYKSIKPKKTN